MASYQSKSALKIFKTVFLLLWFLLLPCYGATEELILPDDLPAKKNEIDWTKPIVSRGFGYKANGEQDRIFEKQFKQAQVAYFNGQYDKAFQLWQPMAEKQHVESIASLAWLYHAGLGTKKNLQQAYELYLQAAAQGNAVAQNNLGTMFEKGEFVPKDLEKAREWYRQSAENAYRFGQFNYASALRHGLGGSIDLESAAIWFRKAAQQGVKQAEQQLLLLEKDGVIKQE